MKKVSMVGIVLALLSSDRTATAKEPIDQLLANRLGTISTFAEPVFANGLLTGCSVNFNTLVRDFTYEAGTFAKVEGSFNLMTAKDSLGVLLKIVVHDFDPKTYDLVPGKPVAALFVSGNATSLPFLIRSLETDTPGAVVAVYDAEKTYPMLVQGLSAGTVTVAFARAVGGMDMQVPVDVTVEDTDDNGNKKRSNKVATSFLECSQDLIEIEMDRLKAE